MTAGHVPLASVDEPGLPRVAVAADQSLVAESVRAALLNRGYDAVVVRWPALDGPRDEMGPLKRHRSRRAAGPPPDLAVLLSDLEKISQVRGAQTLVNGLAVPWLVLAGVPRGPAWGALYECGAALVVPNETGLDGLCGLLDDLYIGPPPEPGPPLELIRSWRAFSRHHGELTERLSTLTGREEEVLQLLYQGLGVRIIAERGEVTEATVRSQVKAILRKLDVRSQIAAVAAYTEVRSSAVERVAVSAGRRWSGGAQGGVPGAGHPSDGMRKHARNA